jgi:ATP-dependent DNA ligase
MVFDLLNQDGRELTGKPLRERHARLEMAVAGSDFVLPVRRLARNGFEAWSEVIARDYEGLVGPPWIGLEGYESTHSPRDLVRPIA